MLMNEWQSESLNLENRPRRLLRIWLCEPKVDYLAFVNQHISGSYNASEFEFEGD